MKQKRKIDSIRIMTCPVSEVKVDGYAVYFPSKLSALLDREQRKRYPKGGPPVSSLNRAVQLYFPDYLYRNPSAHRDSMKPWLIFRHHIDPAWLKALIQSWYRALFHETLPEGLLDEMGIEPYQVLLAAELNEQGNPEYRDPSAFAIVPRLFADKVRAPVNVPSLTKALTFIPALHDQQTDFISWPPERHRSGERDHHYSYRVQLRLHTVPFSSEPELYVHVGIVRWLGEDDRLFLRRSHLTVYARARFPWMSGGGMAMPFIALDLSYDRREKQLQWGDKIAEIAEHMPLPLGMPDPAVLNARAGAYFCKEESVDDGVYTMVPYSGHVYGNHAVKDGAGLPERFEIARGVIEQFGVEDAMRTYPLVERMSIIRKKQVAPEPVSFEIFVYYHSPEWLAKVRESLKLTDEFAVGYTVTEVKMTQSLRFAEKDQAELMDILEEMAPERVKAAGCLFELHDQDHFADILDPKTLIRQVFASRGVLTQFITPDEPGKSDDRFESGVLDLLRQLGILALRTRGFLTKQSDSTFIGLTLIKWKKQKKVTPVLTAVSDKGASMCLPGTGWLTYTEGLLALHAEQGTCRLPLQASSVLAFLNDKLADIEAKHMILFMLGQNTTFLVPKITNKQMSVDRVGLDFPNLSVVRVRDRGNNEVPDWSGTRHLEDDKGIEDVPQAQGTGLYKRNDRTFFSISGKPISMKQVNPANTKADSPSTLIHKQPILEVTIAKCSSPFTPQALAKMTHDLRYLTSIQYKRTTVLPLPLHLGHKAKEYQHPL